MSPREFTAWGTYYRMFPFDDFHRYHRPAAMVAGAMGGGDIEARLRWLQPTPASDERDEDDAHRSEADMNTLRAFGLRKGKP